MEDDADDGVSANEEVDRGRRDEPSSEEGGGTDGGAEGEEGEEGSDGDDAPPPPEGDDEDEEEAGVFSAGERAVLSEGDLADFSDRVELS